MLLDVLKDFVWLNEPSNVRFVETGMQIETEPETDFWENRQHNFFKNNGHFFYSQKNGNFSLGVKWYFDTISSSDQCGIMVKSGTNWAKLGVLTTDLAHPQLGSVVTVNGSSDWALYPLEKMPKNIWFKLKAVGSDLLFFASLDGRLWQQIRMFNLPDNDSELKVGAYACSPQNHRFTCILEDVF